jgi:hypothetical protein
VVTFIPRATVPPAKNRCKSRDEWLHYVTIAMKWKNFSKKERKRLNNVFRKSLLRVVYTRNCIKHLLKVKDADNSPTSLPLEARARVRERERERER